MACPVTSGNLFCRENGIQAVLSIVSLYVRLEGHACEGVDNTTVVFPHKVLSLESCLFCCMSKRKLDGLVEGLLVVIVTCVEPLSLSMQWCTGRLPLGVMQGFGIRREFLGATRLLHNPSLALWHAYRLVHA